MFKGPAKRSQISQLKEEQITSRTQNSDSKKPNHTTILEIHYSCLEYATLFLLLSSFPPPCGYLHRPQIICLGGGLTHWESKNSPLVSSGVPILRLCDPSLTEIINCLHGKNHSLSIFFHFRVFPFFFKIRIFSLVFRQTLGPP